MVGVTIVSLLIVPFTFVVVVNATSLPVCPPCKVIYSVDSPSGNLPSNVAVACHVSVVGLDDGIVEGCKVAAKDGSNEGANDMVGTSVAGTETIVVHSCISTVGIVLARTITLFTTQCNGKHHSQ